jgi:hypothetical protein
LQSYVRQLPGKKYTVERENLKLRVLNLRNE